MTDRVDLARQVIKDFISLYREDPKAARIFLVGTTLSCLALCDPLDRKLIVQSTSIVASKFLNEKFEDGFDFASFMQDLEIKKEE